MKNLYGFTLVELLVLLAVVAILAVIAVPNFSATIKSDRDAAEINTLLTGFALARSEAIKTANNVTVCAGNSAACSNANWADGWIVFYDTLPQGATTSTIRVFAALGGNNTLSSSGGNSFTFNASGMLTPATSSTFVLCDTRGVKYARSIDLNLTGRAEAAAQVGDTISGAALTAC